MAATILTWFVELNVILRGWKLGMSSRGSRAPGGGGASTGFRVKQLLRVAICKIAETAVMDSCPGDRVTIRERIILLCQRISSSSQVDAIM